MQVFNNPHFGSNSGHSEDNSVSSGSKLSVQDIMNKYDQKKQKNGLDRSGEISDLEDSNVSRLLGQLAIDQDQTYNDRNGVSIMETDLFEEMSTLKDQVLGLLQTYQSSLVGQKDKESTMKMREKIKNDAKVIQNNYAHIIDNFNQSLDMSVQQQEPNAKNEQQFNGMFNLVEEFLDKFQGRKATPNLYSNMMQERMQASGFLDSSSLRYSKYDFNEQSETSIVNDTFYNHVENIDAKISQIRSVLQELLVDQQYSKTILMETIDSMHDVIRSQEPTYIRKVMKRIEVQIETLKRESGNTPSTTKLYSLMQQSLGYMQEKAEEVVNCSALIVPPAPQPIDPQALRRIFFDEALKIKSELPSDHPGKKQLVSFLFDQAQQAAIPQSQWASWIRSQFKNDL